MQTVSLPTFADFKELTRAVYHCFAQSETYESYKALQAALLDEPTIKAIIKTQTVKALEAHVYRKGDKKDFLVSTVYHNLLQSACTGDSFSFSPFSEKFEDAIKRYFDKVTPEAFKAEQDRLKAKSDAHHKALTNPETLDEFNTFKLYKGVDKLTSEQLVRFDELRATVEMNHIERQAKQNDIVREVKDVDTDMTMVTSHHAKKNIPLWVVKLSDRVDRDKYQELNNRAKQLGGYYSSYRGQGAIPGFTFESEEQAKLFMQVKDGNVDASSIKEEQRAERIQQQADALQEKGQTRIDAGNESLDRERKTHTHRYAQFAARAEAQAEYDVKFGQTLQLIGEGIENGTIKFLKFIKNMTDLEALDNVLISAKYRHIQAAKLRSDNYEYSNETIEHVQVPFPFLTAQDLPMITRLAAVKGRKIAGTRLVRRLKAYGEKTMYFAGHYDTQDYQTVLCYPASDANFDNYEASMYRERLAKYNRLVRLNVNTIPVLRAALRELLEIKKKAGISPEQKRRLEVAELERKFIGMKIDGFFPTPGDLAYNAIRRIKIWEEDSVCEPNGGLGHFADKLIEMHPKINLQVVEIVPSLAEACRLKGYETKCQDFLQYDQKHDVFVMNPPFENDQDIKHVMHAYSLLNEKGRIVAIMANNKYKDSAREFMEWLEDHGTYIVNPEGSFKSAFRPTGVGTITVTIEKH